MQIRSVYNVRQKPMTRKPIKSINEFGLPTDVANPDSLATAGSGLNDEVCNHMPVDVRQTAVDAVVAIREALVVDSQ